VREGEILRCPWHGWEFDLRDGRSVIDPDGTRVRAYLVETYPVEVEQAQLVLVL
jgi:3-phenylpropionate/trans-cinnamate dioxygenase ferredoxin subunit